MTHRPGEDKFLRAAIKAGLRLQRAAAAEKQGTKGSDGVATLQRIKASLRRRNSNLKTSA